MSEIVWRDPINDPPRTPRKINVLRVLVLLPLPTNYPAIPDPYVTTAFWSTT